MWPTSFWNVSLASNCKRNRLSEYRFSCQLKSFDLNAVLLSLKICRKHVVDVTHFCVSNGPLSAHQHSTIDLICHRLEPCNLAGFDWPIVGGGEGFKCVARDKRRPNATIRNEFITMKLTVIYVDDSNFHRLCHGCKVVTREQKGSHVT